MKFLSTALLIAFSVSSIAQAEEDIFYELTDHLAASCTNILDEKSCSGALKIKTLRDPSDPVHEHLAFHAYEQSQVWIDTILEGDFAVAHEVRLNFIQEVYQGEKLLAYRITYSDTAWETSNCSYWETQVTDGCEPGVIIESAFVRPDFSEAWRDHNAFATFRRLLN